MSKERLVELIAVARNDYYDYSDEMHEIGMSVDQSSEEYIADFLLANGVIAPKHQIGERIYQTDGVRIYESSIHEITYTASKVVYVTESIVFDESAIGTSIFF